MCETGTRFGGWWLLGWSPAATGIMISDTTFASRALALGESLPMIGDLLGHRKVNTTTQYVHHPRGSVTGAADRVSDSVVFDLHTPMTAQVAI